MLPMIGGVGDPPLKPRIRRNAFCLTRRYKPSRRRSYPTPWYRFRCWSFRECPAIACRQSACYILNYMVQYTRTGFDASFAALSDVTRRGVLEQLGRADASITDL